MNTDDMKLVEKAVQELGEHYETVMVFCTRHESGQENGTVRVIKGSGNWFARYGVVREWLIREEETSRSVARKDSSD